MIELDIANGKAKQRAFSFFRPPKNPFTKRPLNKPLLRHRISKTKIMFADLGTENLKNVLKFTLFPFWSFSEIRIFIRLPVIM
jgi:hypothetical protein